MKHDTVIYALMERVLALEKRLDEEVKPSPMEYLEKEFGADPEEKMVFSEVGENYFCPCCAKIVCCTSHDCPNDPEGEMGE
jgi:hypothetical protein